MKKPQANTSMSANQSVGQDSQHSFASQNYQQTNNYVVSQQQHNESTCSMPSRNQAGQHNSSLRMTLQDI
jgi:hypothetical protein